MGARQLLAGGSGDAPKARGHSAILIADYLLSRPGAALTPLHVIKLVYISHGYVLARHGVPLIHDRIEAWTYGPVIPVLYHALRRFGRHAVPSLYYCGTRLADERMGRREEFFREVIKDKIRKAIDDVYDEYGRMPGKRLIELTHGEGTPWRRHFKKHGGGIEIPDSTILEHYRKLADARA